MNIESVTQERKEARGIDGRYSHSVTIEIHVGNQRGKQVNSRRAALMVAGLVTRR